MRTKLGLSVAFFLVVGCGDGGAGQHFGDDAGTGTGGAAGARAASTGGAGGETAPGTGGALASSGGAIGTGGGLAVASGGSAGGLGGHQAATGGSASSGGRGGAAGAPSSATGGRPGTGGAPGSGGRSGSGGAASGGAPAGTGGIVGSGGVSGTGGVPADLCPSSPCGSSDYCCRLPGQAPFCTPNVQGSSCTLSGTGGMTASGGALGSGGAGTGGAGGVVGTGGTSPATGGAGGSAPVPWCQQADPMPGKCDPGPILGHWCDGKTKSLPGLPGLVCWSGCIDGIAHQPYPSDCFTGTAFMIGSDGCPMVDLLCVLDCGECS